MLLDWATTARVSGGTTSSTSAWYVCTGRADESQAASVAFGTCKLVDADRTGETGAEACTQPFPTHGWLQEGVNLHNNVDVADVLQC